jgi:hypothetical protein
VAEGARLESVFRGNSNVGSNPTLSAIKPSNNILRSPVQSNNPLKTNILLLYSVHLATMEASSSCGYICGYIHRELWVHCLEVASMRLTDWSARSFVPLDELV